jgi:ABC-2 type transport system permease protein
MRSQASGFGDILSGIAFIAWSGEVSWRALPMVAAAIVGSAMVCLSSGVLFFSLAFWLGRAETIARQLWEMVVMFSLYPEPLFGGMVRLALFTLLPAGFVGYVPARVAEHPSMSGLLLLTAAVAVYATAAVAMFERGLRRYASGSRFGTFG